MATGAAAAPAPPDPYKTAGAQTGSNIQTGIANSVLGNPNVVGPTGSTTYSQSGETQTVTGPDGKTYQVPRYTQTNTLSAGEQGVYDSDLQTRQNIGQIGVEQSARIGDILGQPVDYSDLKIDPNSFAGNRAAVEKAMFDRLSPQLTRSREAEENRLVNQGFQRGTQAFTDAMGDLGRQENDLRLGITAAGLGEQQGMYGMARDAAGYEMQRRTQQQNHPINLINALRSSSQVSAPNIPGYNPGQVAGTDVSGAVYNSAALQQKQFETDQKAKQAQMAGLYGLAGTGAQAAMWFSDRRLKRDIRDFGIKLANGIKLYTYRYLWDDVPRVGVMADEVLKVRPSAVRVVGGYMAVDYGAL